MSLLRRFTCVAAAALVGLQPAIASAQGLPGVIGAPAVQPRALQGDVDALLRGLGVGAPTNNQGMTPARSIELPPRSPGSPRRDAPISLRAGAGVPVNLPIGTARTITLPGDFDRATVVLPEVADIIPISQNRVQVMARAPGATDIVFANTTTGATYRASVVVNLNASPVQEAINAALPRERISATSIANSIVLGGTVRDVATGARAVAIARRFVADPANGVVNNIQVLGGQQVMIQVRVAEVNRNVVKQFGMNSSVRFGSGAIGNAGLSNSGGTVGVAANLFGDTVAAIANPVGFLSTRALGGILNTTLSALETEGLVRLLAEPTLTALSGSTANFLAGQQYPIPVVGLNGTGGTEYRNFGVALAFTPTVMSANNIAIQIMTEVSTRAESVGIPSGNNVSQVPIFNTRRATTTVELPSGGSIAIAGLIQSDFQNSMSGFPGIRNIPILGRLFSSTDFQRRETELVIIATPYLVEATDAANRLGSPTDGLVPPSDVDLFFMSRLTGTVSRRPGTPPPALSRSIGFITE